MKTDIDIQKWFYHKIKGSELDIATTGSLSDRGRPGGSSDEDVVIAVLANNNAGQVQTAYVNINVYVSDIYNDYRKSWERDTIRVSNLCNLCKFLFYLSDNEYYISAKDSTQRVIPAGIAFQDGHTEHLINNKLFIKICND